MSGFVPEYVTVSADFILAMIEMPQRMSMAWWKAQDAKGRRA